MKCTQAVISSTIGAAYVYASLPVIPTVSFEYISNGTFNLANVNSIVVDTRYAASVDESGQTLIPPTLYEFATTFAGDLSDVLDITVSLNNGTISSNGSIFLTLGEAGDYLDAAGQLSSEGYSLDVSPSGLTITGASSLGVWWGTRTVLQQGLLSVANSETPSIPYGSSIDVPSWATRGMMLDDGRHYYPPDFLTDLCSYMSFFKQNTLHLHLSDNLYNNPNYTYEQSMGLYARFRLWSDDSAVDGLNLYANESYDRPTFDDIQTKCVARGVTVIPEIEAPGHALVITQWKPELALEDNVSLLNISHPDTIPTMKTIWSTFLPWFHSKTVSIGADEYTASEADYNMFVNEMNTFIAAESGKLMRIWGTFPPIYNSTWTNVHQNVSVQHWEYFEDNPYYDYIKNNYSVVNSNDDFYIVNKYAPPGGYLNTINLTKTFHGSPEKGLWRPYIFDQSNATNNPPASSPYVLGSIVPLWNDYGANATVYSEAYYAWREGIPALADKQWGGNLSEAAFAEAFAVLQPNVPGQNLERTIASISDVIVNYTLTLTEPTSGSIEDTSGNGYTAQTDCEAVSGYPTKPALSITDGCSITTPLESKGRNYTLSLSLRVDALDDPTNATILSGRDSVLMLTPTVTLFAGGNYFRSNATVPQGDWFDLSLIGRGNRTYAAVNSDEEEFLAIIGINGVYHHWAEIAIEAPLGVLGGQGSGWSGLFGGLSLTSVA
ncbi:putative beta-hexosaminidase [Truncatella angustata]|uniref:beta-N-acetylhexosaminidase n=1 Tax=Truncatella angustata TaxID=152316 RepID=A0A9P8UCU2_9PEZI|nr:putative beta-hexosaminidase [Truncatella angustata]KAH6647121.1 putative beta-hexosaminidase [Truncatella angustata]